MDLMNCNALLQDSAEITINICKGIYLATVTVDAM